MAVSLEEVLKFRILFSELSLHLVGGCSCSASLNPLLFGSYVEVAYLVMKGRG